MVRVKIQLNRCLASGALLGMLAAAVGCQQITGLRAYTWQSTSMEKTIYKGDTFLCNTNAYRSAGPARGDVVVFQHGNTTLAKRLIGLPGDRVEGRDGVVFVNGKPLDEPYAQYVGPEHEAPATFSAKLVAPGEIFLLGDNRDHSLDSRMDEFGPVKLTDLRGKAVSILRTDHGENGRKIQ